MNLCPLTSSPAASSANCSPENVVVVPNNTYTIDVGGCSSKLSDLVDEEVRSRAVGVHLLYPLRVSAFADRTTRVEAVVVCDHREVQFPEFGIVERLPAGFMEVEEDDEGGDALEGEGLDAVERGGDASSEGHGGVVDKDDAAGLQREGTEEGGEGG
ncbi:hypothetical protein Cni_G20698 [Canna indica]|uniref:Uncharacterized protein n=1 Tax=Canna indica TaxID=4628 RepID=A0AAQ3KNL6_9LILI|nr:hypothetical protein Cni_G20698 [Canna indica]